MIHRHKWTLKVPNDPENHPKQACQLEHCHLTPWFSSIVRHFRLFEAWSSFNTDIIMAPCIPKSLNYRLLQGHIRTMCLGAHTQHIAPSVTFEKKTMGLALSVAQNSLATGGFWGLELKIPVDNPGTEPNWSLFTHPAALSAAGKLRGLGEKREARGNPRVSGNSCRASPPCSVRALGWRSESHEVKNTQV